MLFEYVEEYLQRRKNSLNIMKDTGLLELNLKRLTLQDISLLLTSQGG